MSSIRLYVHDAVFDSAPCTVVITYEENKLIGFHLLSNLYSVRDSKYFWVDEGCYGRCYLDISSSYNPKYVKEEKALFESIAKLPWLIENKEPFPEADKIKIYQMISKWYKDHDEQFRERIKLTIDKFDDKNILNTACYKSKEELICIAALSMCRTYQIIEKLKKGSGDGDMSALGNSIEDIKDNNDKLKLLDELCDAWGSFDKCKNENLEDKKVEDIVYYIKLPLKALSILGAGKENSTEVKKKITEEKERIVSDFNTALTMDIYMDLYAKYKDIDILSWN